MGRKSKNRTAFSGLKSPHIGEMLKNYIKKNRFFQSSWARDMGVLETTILSYYKKPTMQIQTLFDISQVLHYNFFRAIAEALPADMAPKQANPLQEKLDEALKEIEKLNIK